MNYVDSIDVTGDARPGQHPSINEEVAQITGQLGKLWGGFRKQSLSALESARKIDFAQVVNQAQTELGKFVAEEPKSTTVTSPRSSTDTSEKANLPTSPADPKAPRISTGADVIAAADVAAAAQVDVGATTADDPTTPRAPASQLPSSPTQSFFSRLQASLPPNLVQSVQGAIPPNLVQSVQGAIPPTLIQSVNSAGLAQLRGTIGAELARVQHEAEGVVRTSEGYLREAAKGAGEFLREAVKVVPPENPNGAHPGIAWDGSEMWMMDIALGTGIAPGAAAGAKGKEKEVDWSSPVEARKAVATRAQALLRRLRCDPEVLRVDPEADANVKELYLAWFEHDVKAKQGGIEGKEWKDKTDKALQDPSDGEALKATLETLVPTELTNELFWTRYWFRVHQIQREEEKRQALLKVHLGTAEKEEEISWEDDEDEPSSPDGKSKSKTSETATTPVASVPTPVATKAAPGSGAAGGAAAAAATAIGAAAAGAELASQGLMTPTPPSPRHSDEESYDVVSATVSTDEKEEEDEDESSDEDEDEEESSEEESEEEDEDESEEDEAPAVKHPVPAASTTPAKAATPKVVPAKEEEGESDSDWE